MWSRVVRNCVVVSRAPRASAVRRFTTAETTAGASSSSSVNTAAASISRATIRDKIGRDVSLTVVPREARQKARLGGRHGGSDAVVRTTSLPAKISLGMLVGSISGSIVWHFLLDDDVKNKVADTLSATFLGDVYDYLAKEIAALAKPYTDPSQDKLLPDWPIPQVPPNTPPVPVLVLDLEDTLVHSEWSRKHGWRHAKRPGVDEFLETMGQYYEIVVFSQNHFFMAEEVVAKLDRKQHVLHVLGRESTLYHNSAHVKDLSKLNRDLRQVIILDDDPSGYQLQPENAIPVKPYTDGRDRNDHELKDLIPFLTAMAYERVPDFRVALAEFRDDDGVLRDLPSKYGARVRALEMQKQQKGLNGFLRGRLAHRSSSVPPASQL